MPRQGSDGVGACGVRAQVLYRLGDGARCRDGASDLRSDGGDVDVGVAELLPRFNRANDSDNLSTKSSHVELDPSHVASQSRRVTRISTRAGGAPGRPSQACSTLPGRQAAVPPNPPDPRPSLGAYSPTAWGIGANAGSVRA